jgi:hypothetical protein
MRTHAVAKKKVLLGDIIFNPRDTIARKPHSEQSGERGNTENTEPNRFAVLIPL